MIRLVRTLALALTLLVGGVLLPTSARAQGASSDLTEKHLLSMLSALNLVPAESLTTTVRNLQFVENKYKVDPFLLVAIMEREQNWHMAAKGHLFAYHIKHGITDFTGQVALPNPFDDIDTCAHALYLQKERFGDDINATVAAYFVGPTAVDGFRGNYPDEVSELLSTIWATLKEYKQGYKADVRARMPQDPAIVPAGDGTRGAFPGRQLPAGRANPAVVDYSTAPASDNTALNQDWTPTEIEQSYITVMRHFNRKISEETARQIYVSIARYAAQYPIVDARLVMALVATESAFRPNAVSHAGAEGLGQLMPFTSDSLNVSDPFDIDQNIRGTYMYLDREIKRWGVYPDVLDRVLAAYNAGPGAVEKYHGIPPYTETQNYVVKVVWLYICMLTPQERERLVWGRTTHTAWMRSQIPAGR